jgi:hypothetical protein
MCICVYMYICMSVYMYAYTFKTKQACPNLTGPACWHQPAELQTRMPQEKPRPPAHPSTPSFHTSSAPSTKGVFHTKLSTAARRQETNCEECTTTRRHPRRAHILQPARTPAGSCNTNEWYGQHQKPEPYLTSMLPTCAKRPHPG